MATKPPTIPLSSPILPCLTLLFYDLDGGVVPASFFCLFFSDGQKTMSGIYEEEGQLGGVVVPDALSGFCPVVDRYWLVPSCVECG